MENKTEKAGYVYDARTDITSLSLQFSSRFTKFIKKPRDYLIAEGISVSEAHILNVIDDHPGITVMEMAKLWNSTPSAISHVVKKLDEKQLVARKKTEDNAKVVHFYTTDKGAELAQAHKKYNQARLIKLEKEYLQDCTKEELDTFFKVIRRLSDFYA